MLARQRRHLRGSASALHRSTSRNTKHEFQMRSLLPALFVTLLLVLPACDGSDDPPAPGFEATVQTFDQTETVRGDAGVVDDDEVNAQLTGVFALLPALDVGDLPDPFQLPDSLLSDSLRLDSTRLDSFRQNPPEIRGTVITLASRDDDGFGKSMTFLLPGGEGRVQPGTYSFSAALVGGLGGVPSFGGAPVDPMQTPPTAFYTSYDADAFLAAIGGSGSIEITESSDERLRGTFEFTTLGGLELPLQDGRLPVADTTLADSVRFTTTPIRVDGQFTAVPSETVVPATPGF